MTEQEEIWDRLKYGVLNRSTVVFHGNGTATKFNSGWISGSKIVRITVDDVAQSLFRDYRIIWNDIVFKKPPAPGHMIRVEVRS